MAVIRNPILPGFHPDPSICRAGEDFYLANSTFEWFPGVQIHHSRDLVNWRLCRQPLRRTGQLDMTGNPCSGGIWAPCLSYADGLFWLIYTDVKTLSGAYKDAHNYLVTAEDVEGDWSDPVYLNSSGFDPSLFHDDDGRKWLVNMVWDHRPGRNRFWGILLQEYSHRKKALLGAPRCIFRGTGLGCTEGPHLYKRDGWYYLMTAEGGTGYAHAVTVARSRTIDGAYEVDPENPVLTSSGRPELGLQKAGHASLVETPSGEWYLAHLCGRPQGEARRCMLGRETALQKVRWTDDGWLRLEGGGNAPRAEVPAPGLPEAPQPQQPDRDDFDAPQLSPRWQALRVPIEEHWCSTTARPGYLRLVGRESLASRHRQSLVARRVQHLTCRASCSMEFEPEHFGQMAGLVAFYNVENWFYLHVTHDEQLGRVLRLGVSDNGEYAEPMEPVAVGEQGRFLLALTIADGTLRFATGASCDGKTDWQPVGPELDATQLSDEYVRGWGFTGAFVGLCCQDLWTTAGRRADFDWFEYTAGR
jgi:xylan 1,4-beta-xylosidase